MGYRELTRQEKTAIRKLVVQWCANYDRDYGCLLGLGPPRKLYLRGERRSNEMSELSPRAEANDMEFVTTCGCYMLGKIWTGPMCRYFRQAVLPLDPALEQALAQEEVVLEREMRQRPRKGCPTPSQGPRGTQCAGCPYWRGIRCMTCFRELLHRQAGNRG